MGIPWLFLVITTPLQGLLLREFYLRIIGRKNGIKNYKYIVYDNWPKASESPFPLFWYL